MARKRPTFEGDNSREYDDYLVARLALWAGDLAEARLRLQRYQTQGDDEDHRADSALKATHWASRTLHQLNRRVSEYRTIYATADISTNRKPVNILRSAGGRIGAAIWVETDRDYELRSYLLDLEWENTFYQRSRSLSETAVRHLTSLDYGTDSASPTKTEGFALSIEWTAGGPLFIQVGVSDFCTFSGRAVWTSAEPPRSEADIIAPFQRVLDAIDPIDSTNRYDPKSGF